MSVGSLLTSSNSSTSASSPQPACKRTQHAQHAHQAGAAAHRSNRFAPRHHALLAPADLPTPAEELGCPWRLPQGAGRAIGEGAWRGGSAAGAAAAAAHQLGDALGGLLDGGGDGHVDARHVAELLGLRLVALDEEEHVGVRHALAGQPFLRARGEQSRVVAQRAVGAKGEAWERGACVARECAALRRACPGPPRLRPESMPARPHEMQARLRPVAARIAGARTRW